MKFELKKEELLLLHTEICELPVSEKLLSGCKIMGFSTLQEIMDLGWGGLMQQEGFTYRWFTELTAFLESRRLIHLLQANPLADGH